MEPTSPELDTIASLLDQWQSVEGPRDRVRVISSAADALRNLSNMDTRALAQGLWEHGAPNAAEQVAYRTGASVSADDLTEAANALLTLDRQEIPRLAAELRDPGQRRRLLVNSGVPLAEVLSQLPDRPEDGSAIPPPPPPAPEQAPESDIEVTATQPGPAPDPVPDPVAGSAPVESAAASSGPAAGSAAKSAGGPYQGQRPADLRRQAAEADRLATALQSASNGRERLRRLEDADATRTVQQAELLRVLGATPDGWQRRTVLRKLLAGGQVAALREPGEVVMAFGRDGDRFAVAAMLVRTAGVAVRSVAPVLSTRDADRLRRRVQASSAALGGG